MKSAYYNENDPGKAAWLRENIKAGLIALGEVDERSIEDVLPNELTKFTQCHFFAGIGVWSYALRCAGWSDDRPVWTGSCPCTPFSTAGKRAGFADERHLWPAWEWLIRQCRPDVVFGEQVENKDGRAWLDLVQADLEANSYEVGAVGLCAAGLGACHTRHRIFFVANAASGQQWRIRQSRARDGQRQLSPRGYGAIGGVADARRERIRTERSGGIGESAKRVQEANGQRQRVRLDVGECSAVDKLANANGTGRARQGQAQSEIGRGDFISVRGGEVGELGDTGGERLQKRIGNGRIQSSEVGASARQTVVGRGATNGFWANAEWFYCKDGKYRATKPCTFPLADGVARRVLKLRGIGDAIVAPVAEEFIRAYLDFIGE